MSEKILFLEDEEKILRALKSYFEKRAPYEIHTATDGEEAVAIAKKVPLDLIVADVVMPGRDGIETIQEIREFNPDIACIVITGFAEESTPIRALKIGVRDYIKKPFDPAELLNSAENLLRLRRLAREAQQMRRSLEGFRSRLQEILGIIRSTARLSSSAEPSTLMSAIVRLGVDATRAAAGAIFLLDDQKQCLHLAAGVGAAAGGESLQLGQGIAGKVASTGQAICGCGPGSCEVGDRTTGVETDRKSVLAVPLEVGEERLGVLEVFDKADGGFEKRDVALLTSLAQVGAIAISDNRTGGRVKDLLIGALRKAVGPESVAQTGGTSRAIESLRATMDAARGGVDLSGGQERALRVAELIAEIGQHGERELEFCEKMLVEFSKLLKSGGLEDVVGKTPGLDEQR